MSPAGQNGRIYLDHAATSWPKPAEVRERMLGFLTGLAANAGRSGHRAATDSARMVFETRESLAALVGAPDPKDLVFTRGATEGINLVLKGFLGPGDRVLVSPMEHNSVMRPLDRLAAERGVRVDTLPADEFGRVRIEEARKMAAALAPRLVVLVHASNVNGAVQDLAALREAIGEVPLLVDAAQSAGVLPINMARDRIDFLAFSAHKGLLGPTGVGTCYLSPEHEVRPLVEGGTGSRSEETVHPEVRPDRYEAGTLNLHGLAGLLGALERIGRDGLLGEAKRRLSAVLIEELRQVPGVRIRSPADGTALMVSFTLDGQPPERVARRLEDEHGILSRPGLQCAPRAHRHLGTFPSGTVRLSPGFGNTEEDVLRAARAVGEIAAKGGV